MKKTSYHTKIIVSLILSFWYTQQSWAHVVVGELEKMSKSEVAAVYLELGYKHIIPFGFDHILFILSLYLLSPKLKPVLIQSTTFTLAHSVTLALSMYHVITPPSAIVEPLIAISIMLVALENIFSPKLKPSRIMIVFLFGLVHGMGFANALSSMGLPENAYLTSLVMFNIGVELGQLSIIFLSFFAFGKWFSERPFYRKRIVIPLSVFIIAIAGYWTVQRILLQVIF